MSQGMRWWVHCLGGDSRGIFRCGSSPDCGRFLIPHRESAIAGQRPSDIALASVCRPLRLQIPFRKHENKQHDSNDCEIAKVGLLAIPRPRLPHEETLARNPSNFGQLLLNQLDSDLRNNSAALKAGITRLLPEALPGVDLSSYNFDIRVDECQPRIFRIETPFVKDFQLAPDKVHQVLQRAVGSVSNLNHRFSEMIEFSALSGFREDEAPILFGKVAGLMAPQNPETAEGQFKRILEIADVPDFEPNQKVDVDRLLDVRESDECRAFRDWLSKAGSLGDAELRDLIGREYSGSYSQQIQFERGDGSKRFFKALVAHHNILV